MRLRQDRFGSSCRDRLGERRERIVDLGGANRERRREPDDVLARRQHEEAVLPARADDGGPLPVDDGAEEQAAPANRTHAGERREALGERCTLRSDIREQRVIDRLHDGAGRRA